MKWKNLILCLMVLSVTILTGCASSQSSTENCSSRVKVNVSWSQGIEFTFNHCEVRDILAGSAAAAGISTLMAEDCPNAACKLAAGALAAFIVSQVVELQDIDNQCGNRGAILEVGSYRDKTLWEIKPICGLADGHLLVTDNNLNRESQLNCGSIYLSFLVNNVGGQAIKWHVAIYYGDTNLQPEGLRTYIEEDGKNIRTGRTHGTYDEEGLIANQKTTVAVAGNIDPRKMKQYGEVTLRYIVVGGDNQNPPSISIKCL